MRYRDLYDEYIQPLSPIPTDLTFTVNVKTHIKAVLFDVYGTLFVSASGDISTSKDPISRNHKLEALLKKYQISVPVENLLSLLTFTIRETHAKLKENNIDYPEVKIDKIWMMVLNWKDIEKARTFAQEFELIVNPVYPMPNLGKALTYIKQKQIPMGVISNAQFYTVEMFEYFLNQDISELGFQPELTFMSYQYNRAKPSPYLFELAAKYLKNKGIPADNVLYVGNDMLNDIYTAKSVGFCSALFAGDLRSLRLRKNNEACKNIIPDVIISDLAQLTDVI